MSRLTPRIGGTNGQSPCFFCARNAPHSVHFCIESGRSGISLPDVGGYLVADAVSGRTDRASQLKGRRTHLPVPGGPFQGATTAGCSRDSRVLGGRSQLN